jgi:hypothetical protein
MKNNNHPVGVGLISAVFLAQVTTAEVMGTSGGEGHGSSDNVTQMYAEQVPHCSGCTMSAAATVADQSSTVQLASYAALLLIVVIFGYVLFGRGRSKK